MRTTGTNLQLRCTVRAAKFFVKLRDVRREFRGRIEIWNSAERKIRRVVRDIYPRARSTRPLVPIYLARYEEKGERIFDINKNSGKYPVRLELP